MYACMLYMYACMSVNLNIRTTDFVLHCKVLLIKFFTLYEYEEKRTTTRTCIKTLDFMIFL